MPNPVLLVAIVVIAGLVLQFLISYRRHRRSFRKQLEPLLAQHDLEFVSATWPGWFKVGPFPKVEVEVGRPQSRVGGFRGEYTEYRIVTFQTPEGEVHQLWVKIEFEIFQLRRIQWRAEKGQSVSKQAQKLLRSRT